MDVYSKASHPQMREEKKTMKMISSKKGVVDRLQPLVIALVVVGVTLAIAMLIMAEIQTNNSVKASKNASKAVNETINAIGDVPGWLPIIVITLIGALLIGLVAMFRGSQ